LLTQYNTQQQQQQQQQQHARIVKSTQKHAQKPDIFVSRAKTERGREKCAALSLSALCSVAVSAK